ncbi:hypothetical protein OQ496_05000 [Acetobacter suratthaniensis]|uniref:Uncharacterized protein n=1 Tax=Acetobacter suratthaniensis TaxID=1502841 RepID=A0ABS3LN68_9PROT|nr:hypothetical protein [Acetobacter suratthaniensis]MBO1328800.1 hypothetical protein [Acetobacter suratthaniensis]MCX2565813.1 hypothetical protein [Acetobacter suratthaniensis]
MVQLRKSVVSALCAAGIGFVMAGGAAWADPALTPNDSISFAEGNAAMDTGSSRSSSTEKKTVHGHRNLPPGYQDAPSMDFQHGDDPDQLAKVQRDSVTGADVTKYGSAYQASSPFGTGQVGDSTGSGWVIPR